MATAIVAVGCYYGYTASGGPVGVGQATAKSMILNMVLVHLIGMMGSQIFWGANPRAPIGGLDPMTTRPLRPRASAGGWLDIPAGLDRQPRRASSASAASAFGDIFNGRVFHFFGETLRQAGILILGSAIVIWGMVFILGLSCGIEAAYLNRQYGAPAYAGCLHGLV